MNQNLDYDKSTIVIFNNCEATINIEILRNIMNNIVVRLGMINIDEPSILMYCDEDNISKRCKFIKENKCEVLINYFIKPKIIHVEIIPDKLISHRSVPKEAIEYMKSFINDIVKGDVK